MLLAGRVGSRRVLVRHIAGYSLAAHSPAVADRSPGLAAGGDNRVVGSRPGPSRVVEGGIGLGEGIAAGAGSPGYTGRKGRTLCLCDYAIMRGLWLCKMLPKTEVLLLLRK